MILAVSACGEREGTSTAFEPEKTTNGDFVVYSIPAQNQPIGLAVEDFDGDTREDHFAVSNYLAGTVSVYTQTSGATFSVQTVALGGRPTQIEFADLDGGGASQMDLAVVIENDLVNSVAIVLNNGTSFSVAAVIPTGTVIAQMSAACMQDPCANGSAEDLVLSLPNLQSVRVLKNDGFGAFTGVNTVVAAPPGQFDLADFNPTSALDVVVTLPGANAVQVLLGSGDGSLSSSVVSGTEAEPFAVVAAPLHSGPQVDLTVSCRLADRVSVLFGDGVGGFTSGGYVEVKNNPERLIIDRFSGPTGVNDAVVVNRGEKRVAFLKNNGSGGFARYDVGTSDDPFDLAAGDFTGDTNLDFVAVELNKRVLGVYRGDGSVGFARSQVAFDSVVTQPKRVKMCNPAGPKDDLLLVQSNSDRVLLLCNVN